MSADTLLAEPGHIAGTVSGSQQDNPRGGEFGALPDLGGQREAVDARHPGVEKNERVWPAAGRSVPKGVNGRHSVADRHRLHLPSAEPLLEDVTVRGVIIDDERTNSAQAMSAISRNSCSMKSITWMAFSR